MMIQIETDPLRTFLCYRCGKALLPGEGRYNVLPGESCCSWTCLKQTLPHIAEAIARFT